MFSADRVYALDIETSTSPVVGPHGRPGYNPGLDPVLGFITDVVTATGDQDTSQTFSGHESIVLALLDQHLRSLEPGLFVTWGGGNFDLPFLDTRAKRARVRLGLELVHQDGLQPKSEPLPGHGPNHPGLDGALGHSGVYTGYWQAEGGMHVHLDISYAYKAFANERGIRCRLKDVCNALEVPVIEVDRERMHLLSDQERHDYVASDGNGTRRLALRLLGHPDWREA